MERVYSTVKTTADILFYSSDLPLITVRMKTADLVTLQFEPDIHSIEFDREIQPAAPMNLDVMLCAAHGDVVRSSAGLRGAGVRVALAERGLPSSYSNLAIANQFGFNASTSPRDTEHARRMAYLVRNDSGYAGEIGGFAPAAELYLGASVDLGSSWPWLVAVRSEIVIAGLEETLPTQSVNGRNTLALIADYISLIAHRPLVVAAAGNGSAGPCTPVSLPLYNGLVTGGVLFEAPFVCSANPKAPSASSEGNPEGLFGNAWELPHTLAPSRELYFDNGHINHGTSFAAAITGSYAAALVEAYRLQYPGSRPPPEALRAVAMAGGVTSVDHGNDQLCGESRHTMAQFLDENYSYGIIKNRAPRGSAPVALGFDFLSATAGDFRDCHPASRTPPWNPVLRSRDWCELTGGSWKVISQGVRPGVSSVNCAQQSPGIIFRRAPRGRYAAPTRPDLPSALCLF